MTRALLGRGAVGRHRHDAAAAADRELHGAGRAGVQRVVAAHADALAGLEAAAALTDDDLAPGDGLAGEHLHAEAFGVRVAAVAGGAEALLVCHLLRRLLGGLGLRATPRAAAVARAARADDVGDLDAGEVLPVAGALAIAALGLELEDPQLLAANVLDDLRVDANPREVVGTEHDVVGAEHDGLERHGGARLIGQALDEEGLALLDAVLLAAGLHDRIHAGFSVCGSCFRLGSGTAPSASAATAPRLRGYRIVFARALLCLAVLGRGLLGGDALLLGDLCAVLLGIGRRLAARAPARRGGGLGDLFRGRRLLGCRRLLRRRGLGLLAPRPGRPRGLLGLRLGRLRGRGGRRGRRGRGRAVVDEHRGRRGPPGLDDPHEALLAHVRAAAGDRHDVAVDLRDRVIDLVHVRLHDLDEHLVAVVEGDRLVADLVERALHHDLEVVERQALRAGEQEVLARLDLHDVQHARAVAGELARHARVHLHEERLGLAGRAGAELAQPALELDRDRLLRQDDAVAVAGRARPSHDLAHALRDVLARHLDQAELGDLGGERLRAVLVERLAQRLEHRLAVARPRHVDEVDDDDAADVAQAQLVDDRLGRLEVRARDRVLQARLLAAPDERAGVDVDDRQRLGVVDHQVAAAGQVDAARDEAADHL